MQKLNKSIRILFFVSLALSIGFPLGILGIIFGAVYFIVPLLVIGIILVVGGFYAMPILWTKYADKRHDRTLLFMIEHEYIYTVADLAAQTGFKEKNVRERVKNLIMSHYLVGYLFRDDMLERNTNKRQSETSARTKECPRCCATMWFDGIRFRCDYCKFITTDD